MNDYVYPSIFFAYFFFFLLLVGAVFFFVRSFKDGYWGRDSEAAKYQMMSDDERTEEPAGEGRNER